MTTTNSSGTVSYLFGINLIYEHKSYKKHLFYLPGLLSTSHWWSQTQTIFIWGAILSSFVSYSFHGICTLNLDHFQSLIKNQGGRGEWNMYQAHEQINFCSPRKVKKHRSVIVQPTFLHLKLQPIQSEEYTELVKSIFKGEIIQHNSFPVPLTVGTVYCTETLLNSDPLQIDYHSHS